MPPGLVTGNLRLTAPDCTRSVWRLPKWFYTEDKKKRLTYHSKDKRWPTHGNHSILHSVGIG